MELIGRTLKKTFPGFGVYSGIIESYDPSAGYFKVLYEDGDSEDIDFAEISALLSAMGEAVPELRSRKGSNIRGRPKKRLRRDVDEGIIGEDDDLGGGARIRVSENSSGSSEEIYDFNIRRVTENGVVSGEDNGNLSKEEQGSKRRRRESLYETSLRSARRGSDNVMEDVESELPSEVPKVELPPSSKDLDLDGLSVLDFFSVYAFLRSFSRVLFLSPFSLQAFLAALRCRNADSLIDAIHFSVLQALRQNLSFLSQEGSDSATDCLRSLNWGLLDLATWPVHLCEYILIRNPAIICLLKNTQSKLLNEEYYLLPAGLKLDILRCLCDDILEAEIFRSEIGLRMTKVDVGVDSWNVMARKRNEVLANDMTEETADGNSDECILCGMDGSLICCDGCPAAFHSKCVGIAQDLLPEGDWYCPECLIDKCDGLTKFLKSSRGAEILGADPHGRLYFSSCGYLLVLDSCETVSTCNFYNKDDLNVLIKMLKLSHASYEIIANTISTCWSINADTSVSVIQPRAAMTGIVEVFNSKLDSKNLLTLNQNDTDDHIVEKQPKDPNLSEDGVVSTTASDISHLNLIRSDQPQGMSSLCEISEPTDEMTHVVNSVNVLQQTSVECSTVGNPVKVDCCSESVDIASLKKTSFQIGGWISKESQANEGKESIMHQQADPGRYVNYYIFSLLASSVAKEFLGKSADSNYKESKSDDDLMSRQLKAISKLSNNLCWYSYLKLSLEDQKERCGWCYLCRKIGSTECIFVLMDGKRLESSKSRLVGLRSEKKRKSHLISAIQQLLSLEDRLRGFLSGPWACPNYSSQWRKAVSKASQVITLGHMLLTLELNLRRVALSPDWTKLTDSTDKVGSGFYVLSDPEDLTTTCSGSRKHGKRTTPVVDLDSLQATDQSDICWWRGGRLSRQVFHWKMLPHSLVLKSARQAGCKKIPILTYPDGSDSPRRSKFVAWRASVEVSKTVSQLIFQIKEFDYHVRWSELYKTPPSLQLTKESTMIDRLFKKVIIRKRRTEGGNIQYLLDFGKRQNIPPIVTKYGNLHEEPTCERKRFWMGELHVPLYLLKSFEERKIACSLKKSETKLLSGSANNCILGKTKKLKGLSYLMSKAEQLHIEVCTQCNKDVLVRDAVVCHECKGHFHKKHFKMTKGGLATTYTCFSCKLKETDKLLMKMKESAKLIVEEREPDKLISEKNEVAKMVLVKRETDKFTLKKKGAANWVLEKKIIDNMVSEKNGTDKLKTSLETEDSKENKKTEESKENKKTEESKENKKTEDSNENKKTEDLKENKKTENSKENKNSDGTLTMVLRKKRKSLLVESMKQTYGTKQSKRSKTKKTQSGNTNTIRDSSKRKRTTRPSVFWLNGLLWSRKPDDKRGENFRNKRVRLPSQNMENTSSLVCGLCLKEYSPEVIYVGCENCEVWFHGDIYDLSVEDVSFLMGFKCPNCRARSIPCCPFSLDSAPAEDKSPTKSTHAEEKTFHGPYDNAEQHSLNHEMVDKVKKDEEMELSIAEPETESYDHLPFVPPAMVENQHALHQEKDCNIGTDQDMPDGEVLKAEPGTESCDLQPYEPLATVQNEHSLVQEKDVSLGVDEDMSSFVTEAEVEPPCLPFSGLAEDEAISLKHADDNHLTIVAETMGHNKNRTVEISELLTAGTVNHTAEPHSEPILWVTRMVDIEGGNS